jgi:hypothetical protein
MSLSGLSAPRNTKNPRRQMRRMLLRRHYETFISSIILSIYLQSDIDHRSGAIDLEQLSIAPGRHAFCLTVQIVCLSRDGSLLDSLVLATVCPSSIPPLAAFGPLILSVISPSHNLSSSHLTGLQRPCDLSPWSTQCPSLIPLLRQPHLSSQMRRGSL